MIRIFAAAITALALWGGAVWAAAPGAQQVTSAAVSGFAITPSDTTVFSATSYLYNANATACNMAVLFMNDTAPVTLIGVPVGAMLPVRVIKVMATNTTCTAIVGLY